MAEREKIELSSISDKNLLKSKTSRDTLAGLSPVHNELVPRKQSSQKLNFTQWLSKTHGNATKYSATPGPGASTFMGAAGSVLDVSKGLISTQESKGKNPTGFEEQQIIGDAMTKVPIPIVQAAGIAYKGISQLAEATGGNINRITKDDEENWNIGKGNRVFNNIIGTMFPGAGWGKHNDVAEGKKSHLISEMNDAYSDTVSDINQAERMGGSSYLFGRKKIESNIQQANRNNELLTEMNMTNTMRKQSGYGKDLAQQNMNRYAGTNYMDMRMGRKGMKIQNLEEIRELLKNRVVEELDVQKFAEGGSLLPVGKLHKELNHMQELGEQFEDLTRKGIPVITVDESGDLTQVAEIEHSEWIMSKSLTDEVEVLWKDGSEDAMIQCGKLICDHLLRETKDENNVIWESEKQQKNS